MNNFDKLVQAAARPQPAQMQIAAPINDIQLIALIAAHLYNPDSPMNVDSVKDAVGIAVEIIMEAVRQGQQLGRPGVRDG